MDTYFVNAMPLSAAVDRANQNFDFTHSPYVSAGMQQYTYGGTVTVDVCGVGAEPSPFADYTF